MLRTTTARVLPLIHVLVLLLGSAACYLHCFAACFASDVLHSLLIIRVAKDAAICLVFLECMRLACRINRGPADIPVVLLLSISGQLEIDVEKSVQYTWYVICDKLKPSIPRTVTKIRRRTFLPFNYCCEVREHLPPKPANKPAAWI